MTSEAPPVVTEPVPEPDLSQSIHPFNRYYWVGGSASPLRVFWTMPEQIGMAARIQGGGHIRELSAEQYRLAVTQQGYSPPQEPRLPDPPSVTKQTQWRCALVSFPKDGLSPIYFNPSCIELPDGRRWLAVRRVLPKRTDRGWMEPSGIVFFEIGEGLCQLTGESAVCDFKTGDYYEDPRLFRYHDRTWMSCVHYRPRFLPRQIVVSLTDDWQPDEELKTVFGFNQERIESQLYMEKNWTWFDHDDQLHMIYRVHPDHVVVITDHGVPRRLFRTEIPFRWPYGPVRGGTPPVRVGDEYFAFFHSSTPWRNAQRRYHGGAYAFAAKPPFNVTRMTKMPLLTGSERDPRRQTCPPVVFPGGAIFTADIWRIGFGVNDTCCGVIAIPHSDLLKHMDGPDI